MGIAVDTGALGWPEEVAEIVVIFVSDKSRYVGQSLDVSRGKD
jgi:hypothetical protein